MYSESDTDLSQVTVEDKRRKNIIDNQNFLESLKLLNVREDLKSTVNLATTGKTLRKSYKRKENIHQSERRRSSRIQTKSRINYNDQSLVDDEDCEWSADESSSDENDDLSLAFVSKMDTDWQPSSSGKLPAVKNIRPIRKVVKIAPDQAKIFLPNTGLEASKVLSKTKFRKSYVSKKLNVAISSSSED
ncbi:unnamed protein product [Rotaria magnacalcarata]|uniref:Uncharacterized protein n=1 Tax=Rotaria magnacalcarata TaxID=392030 RepID=A0A816GIH8_9BILA|nr:unnamed protein product [Rotaria magnacalcarata]CAF1674155.1 unnamed protein product [Rotaria magnacalcarata]CAF2046586.1 unnamed protein product [Rotaria magnacalcarata]CAF4077652.1 unnamed protein product [Rotaria magnacalcarata]CAF4394906.1 unnamed protein product [Rotaria magnacalcarata]